MSETAKNKDHFVQLHDAVRGHGVFNTYFVRPAQQSGPPWAPPVASVILPLPAESRTKL